MGSLSGELRLVLGLRSSRTTHKIQHLLLRDRAIFVGIHRFEDAFVSGLELLQRDGHHRDPSGRKSCAWRRVSSYRRAPSSCRVSSTHGPSYPRPCIAACNAAPYRGPSCRCHLHRQRFCCTCSHCCIFAASSESSSALAPIAPETRANVTADSTRICFLMGKLLCGWHHMLPSLNSIGARLIPTNCRNKQRHHRQNGAIRSPSPLNFIPLTSHA